MGWVGGWGGVKKRQLASTADGSGTQPRFPLHWNGLAVMNEPLPLAPLQGLRENSVSCRWLETLRKRDKYTIACLITFLVGTVENNGLIIPRTMPTTSGPLLTRGGDVRPSSKTSSSSLLITETAALPSLPLSLSPPRDEKENT